MCVVEVLTWGSVNFQASGKTTKHISKLVKHLFKKKIDDTLKYIIIFFYKTNVKKCCHEKIVCSYK